MQFKRTLTFEIIKDRLVLRRFDMMINKYHIQRLYLHIVDNRLGTNMMR